MLAAPRSAGSGPPARAPGLRLLLGLLAAVLLGLAPATAQAHPMTLYWYSKPAAAGGYDLVFRWEQTSSGSANLGWFIFGDWRGASGQGGGPANAETLNGITMLTAVPSPWTSLGQSSGYHNGPDFSYVLNQWSTNQVGNYKEWAVHTSNLPGPTNLYWSTIYGTVIEWELAIYTSAPFDKDQDGFLAMIEDCDDTNASIGGKTTWYRDSDGDTWGAASPTTASCAQPTGYTNRTGDCDDTLASINPGASEVCDGVDQDCDGAADDGLAVNTWYEDEDEDGVGGDEALSTTCGTVPGAATSTGDCDDAAPDIYPGAEETCDGADQDCDGATDEGLLISVWPDADADGHGASAEPLEVCSVPAGSAVNDGDCDDTRGDVHPGADEVCDGADQDCDGATDEGVTTTFYQDADDDGFGDVASTAAACSLPTGYETNATDCDDGSAQTWPGAPETCGDDIDQSCDGVDLSCDDVDNDGDGATENQGDCDDTAGGTHPGAEEVCDGVDQDCDGEADDGVLPTWYTDGDGDGFGHDAAGQSCAAPEGAVASDTDCDDDAPGTFPGADEVCDAADQDCDGTADEGVTTAFYADADADGYGADGTGVAGCEAPEGYVADDQDCDDTDDAIHPDAADACGDGIDQDCTGADRGCDTSDADGDGSSEADGDCDDGDPAVHPGATEIPYDGVDDDCDGADLTDADADGYVGGEAGDDCDDEDDTTWPGAPQVCDGGDHDCDGAADQVDGDQDGDLPPACGGTDCDDADPTASGSAEEVTDGVDNDCDGAVDELPSETDDDGDGYAETDGDCDDADPDVNPGAQEVADNGADDDCDGQIDEAEDTPTPTPGTPTPAEDTPTPGEDTPTTGDTTPTPDGDGTPGDDATPIPEPTDPQDCGCAQSPAADPGGAAATLLLLGLATVIRRRR